MTVIRIPMENSRRAVFVARSLLKIKINSNFLMIISTKIIHPVPCTRKSLKKTNTDVSTDGLQMRSSMERLE